MRKQAHGRKVVQSPTGSKAAKAGGQAAGRDAGEMVQAIPLSERQKCWRDGSSPSLCPSGRRALRVSLFAFHTSVPDPLTRGRGGHAWAAKGICRPKEAMLDFMKYCEPNGWGHKDVAWRWEVPSWAKRSVGSQSMWGFSAREAEIMLAQHSPPTHTHRLA